MAIQEIEVSKRGNQNAGFKREIDEGAMGLVMDTIQITQYVKPEESTVRELTSNAVDSQREKEIALSILSGEKKVEDYYISRDGLKYKDSNFDSSYYDPKHLDNAISTVDLIYKEGEGTGFCDRFIVRDYGVGLGGKRLEGYFKLGYSSKRNSKSSLGAFGFGNKVALSTRCEYYTTTTVYNGMKFKFNCYSYKMDSLVPKFNLDTGEKNDFITFEDGSVIYYEKTDEKNFTEIEIPVKRHNRQKYTNAVKSQLLYFNNVNYTIEREYGEEEKVNFQANVLFESDNLIVSDNRQFSKPHIIITKGEKEHQVGVCYGYIDFLEMEQEQLFGNIGIKCPIQSLVRDDVTGKETILQEGVEVTPSRESVVWSEHTRAFLKKRFEDAVLDATELIQEKLNTNDIVEWLVTTSDVMKGRGDSNRALSELYNIIDKSSISPKLPGTDIKYTIPVSFFRGMKARTISNHYDYKLNKDVTKRHPLEHWSSMSLDNVYIKTGPTSVVKDRYLHTLNGGFITIELQTEEERVKNYLNNETKSKNLTEKYYEVVMAQADKIFTELLQSKHVKSYDDVVVPEDFGKKVEEAIAEEKQVLMSAAERRKLTGKITYQYLNPNSRYGNSWGVDKDKPFFFSNTEIKISELEDWADQDTLVIYGTTDDVPMLTLLGHMLDRSTEKCNSEGDPMDSWHSGSDYKYNNPNLRIVKVSKQNEKHFKSNSAFWHVDDFFQTITPVHES